MSEFQAGWWSVARRGDGSKEIWYFIDRKHITSTAVLMPNGDQVQYFRPSEAQPHLLRDWLPSYELLGDAAEGETWDNDKYGADADANIDVPKDFIRETRKPSAQELSVRANKADECKADGLSCVREIHVGIFFDGTNNNMYRDRGSAGHSNVVSLFDVHRFDKVEYFKYYIPGVGTPFEQIGELGEDSRGKSMARGGEARIHYALIQLYNSVSRSVANTNLIEDGEATEIVDSIWAGLRTIYRHSNESMIHVFKKITKRLLDKVQGKRPHIIRLHLSVFGFSRGAAEARTFINWAKLATAGKVGPAELNIRFVGLYDTVASVLLADSAPVGGGFLDWANGTMGIPAGVEQTVHYCAGHEIRRSFPLSTLRMGGSWPAQAKEFVYPGVHSDIGGGYAPGDQGKGRGGRSDMLSQIPLNDMYFESVNGGVKLDSLDSVRSEVANDYKITPALQSAFSAYLQWTPTDEKGENVSGSRRGHMEGRMQTQMQHYWRWRGKYTTDAALKTLKSWGNASAQDKVDLEEGNKDWQIDLERARAGHAPRTVLVPIGRVPVRLNLPAFPSQTQRDVISAVDDSRPIPADVDRFFDDYVHDSHAGFWMLGPITRIDKAIFVNEIRKRNAMRERHLERARLYSDMGEDDAAVSQYRAAVFYELNGFEQKVLQANPTDVDIDSGSSHANIPMMRDSDAEDLRDNMGLIGGSVVKNVLGSGTRREANGAGQYRRVMDRDHEWLLNPGKAAVYNVGKAVDTADETVKDIIGGAYKGRIDAGKEVIKDAVEGVLDVVIPSRVPRF